MILCIFLVATLACSSFHEPTSVSDSSDGKKWFRVSPPVSIKSTSSSNSKSGDPPPRPKKGSGNNGRLPFSQLPSSEVIWRNINLFSYHLTSSLCLGPLRTWQLSMSVSSSLSLANGCRCRWLMGNSRHPPDYGHPDPSPDLTSGWNRIWPFGCHKWQNYSYQYSVQ